MLNLIFAMGPNGEFGMSREYRHHIVDNSTNEELRELPTNGLPWKCPSDMLFFRAMTTGMFSQEGNRALNDLLRGHFPGNQLSKVIRQAWGETDIHNVCLAGRKTWLNMSVPNTQYRSFLPFSRRICEDNGFDGLKGMLESKHFEQATTWIIGGREMLLLALELHAKKEIQIDNMFISAIKTPCRSDIFLPPETISAYIDSSFQYNNEYMENNSVLIQRYRGNK